MGQIYIEWKWVAGVLPYRHLYLIYPPYPDAPIEEWEVIRGGPGGLIFGDLVTSIDPFPISADRYAEDEEPEDRGSRLLLDGAEADEAWLKLLHYARDISDEYAYNLIAFGEIEVSFAPSLNSNSLIKSILYHAGIEIEGNEPLGDGSAPGMYNLLGTTADETLHVHGQTVVLFGGGGDDILIGDARDNALQGGLGDDIFLPGGGSNYIHGGQQGLAIEDDGFETVDYSSSGGAQGVWMSVIETPEAPIYIVDHATGVDLLLSIEKVILTQYADILKLEGIGEETFSRLGLIDFGDNPAGDPDVADFSGLGFGIDITLFNDPALSGVGLSGLTLNRVEKVIGTDHGDSITGSSADEIIIGGAGADRLDGGAGNDRIFGGAGDDLLLGARATTTSSRRADTTSWSAGRATIISRPLAMSR